MRIALVTEFYYPHLGGVTEHVHNLAEQYNADGHPTIIVTSEMGDRSHDGPHVRRIGTSRIIYSSGSFARITTGWNLHRQLRDLFKSEQIDVVHVHGGLTPTLALTAPKVARSMGIPVVATFHSWFPRSHLMSVFRKPLQTRIDWHAANIAVSAPVIEAHGRYVNAEWEVIPNGVNTDFFTPDAKSDAYRTGDGPQLLFLGRLDPRNGLETALSAMEMVRADRPDARLTIVGDGPLRSYYEHLSEPVRDVVRFVGSANGDRPKRYASADMYLCPTTKASFGITLLEAMACGIPQAVSDVTGFRELVDGGEEAALVPMADARAWADTALELIEDPARRERMGRAGREKSLTYSWPVVAERVMQVYRRVTK
jgi:phosphatidylinositol alpha-mannosyltransferase